MNYHLFNMVLSKLFTGVFAESTNIPPNSEKQKNASLLQRSVMNHWMPFSFIRSKNLAMENKIMVEQNKIMLKQGLQLSNEIRMGKKKQTT